MQIALSPHVQDPRAQNVNCDWKQLCDFYRSSTRLIRGKTKEDQPMIAFGAFAGTIANGTIDPEGAWAIGLDLDDVPDASFRNAVELAQTLSDAGLAHTTWQHGTTVEGTTRGRIVIPFDTPVPAEHWETTWERFAHVFATQAGVTIDPACKNIGRRFWLPSVNVHAPPPFNEEVWLVTWGDQ